MCVLTQSGLNSSPVMGSSAQLMRYSVGLSPMMASILYTGLEGWLWLCCVEPTDSSWDFQRSANNLALLDRICSVPGSALFLRFRVLIMQLTWLAARIYWRHWGGLYISIGCLNGSRDGCVQEYTLSGNFIIPEKMSGSEWDALTNPVSGYKKIR